MRRAGLVLAATWLLAAAAAGAGDPELGRRLYRDGILSSGQPVEATTPHGMALRGAAAACARCHRRSGFGGSEGYSVIPPIAGPVLFNPTRVSPARLGRGDAPVAGARPAYDEAGLTRALHAGIDPAGRPLNALMPRYPLDDADLGHLAAYLRTLSATPDPGVDATTLHFATVVDAAADPARRQAMLEVLEAFFRDKNAGTRLEPERARRAPWDMARQYQAYRRWQLHVWTLSGPAATWPAQLAAHYRRQPVFALLAGIGAGDWRPVHDFCERTGLPCLFPDVDQPPQAPGQYTLYFSRGLAMEAEALAVHLGADAGMVAQVYRADAADAARALRAARLAAGLPAPVDHPVAAGQALDAGFWRAVGAGRPDTLVLWLRPADLATLDGRTPAPARLYLSARLAGLAALPNHLAARAALVYPWELPQRQTPRLQRLDAWLKRKGLAPRADAIQANTFFVLSQVGEALMHMVDRYSRDYLIERIEHGLENALAPSAYPRPSLGPGQRHAVRGSYVVRAAGDHLDALGGWIVPERSTDE